MKKEQEKETPETPAVTPVDTNPDYPQGDPIPAAIPQPFTVPDQPWQMPPGSAIPV
jgi:hypothetical protein